MIRFEKVSKQIGNFSLQDVSFVLPKGYIMCLIGENGAGKTSLLNLILGLCRPDNGSVMIFDCEYKMDERYMRNQIGYVLLDTDLFLANSKLMDQADLIGKYYAGYNRAVLHIITEFIRDGEHSAILATHQLQEADRIADYIAFLHQGRLLYAGEKEQLADIYRMVKGEVYKINLLHKERIVYQEIKQYTASALVRHIKNGTYDSNLTVSTPTLEEIMYYFIKAEGK